MVEMPLFSTLAAFTPWTTKKPEAFTFRELSSGSV